jgi:UDP-glucose 4-epimerase
MNLKGAKVLITGGAGFVGSHIADQALDAGASHITVIDNFIRGRHENLRGAAASEKLEVIDGDVCNRDLIFTAMQGVDVVFHQAAMRITHCADEPVRAVEVMGGGMLNVLEAAVQCRVGKIVAASSASVYGDPSYLPMDEAHPFNNRTLYGALKIADEQMLRAYSEMFGIRYLAFRPFNVYGPRMDAYGAYTEVMIRWMERLGSGLPPIIFGDGSQSMDFIYVTDLARAYILAALSDESDEVMNIGSGIETTLTELCQLLCRVTSQGEIQPVYEPARKVAAVSRRRASITKAQQMLGWEPKVSLEDGLTELVAWFKTLKGLEVVTPR